jgi:hypothetical protein
LAFEETAVARTLTLSHPFSLESVYKNFSELPLK